VTAWSCTLWLDEPVRGRLWDHECTLDVTGTLSGKRLYLTATLKDPLQDGFPDDDAELRRALAEPGAFLTGFIDRDGRRWSGELALGMRWRMRLAGGSEVPGVIGLRGTVQQAATT
jgi:hypothetical protein